MASTRFSNDKCRISKNLQESTGPGKYMLNVPGPNTNYLDDPHIRMQKFAGNLHNNFTTLEREVQKPSHNFKDCINFRENKINTTRKYNNLNNNNNEITSQSRTTNPVWDYRGIENNTNNIEYLFKNPQDNAIIPFISNTSSRLLDKDNFLVN